MSCSSAGTFENSECLSSLGNVFFLFSADKESPSNAGDPRLTSGWGRSLGGGIGYPLQSWASLVTQLVKNSLAKWETWFDPLGWEDPLEKRMATHSSVLAWRIPRTEEPGELQSMRPQRV